MCVSAIASDHMFEYLAAAACCWPVEMDFRLKFTRMSDDGFVSLLFCCRCPARLTIPMIKNALNSVEGLWARIVGRATYFEFRNFSPFFAVLFHSGLCAVVMLCLRRCAFTVSLHACTSRIEWKTVGDSGRQWETGKKLSFSLVYTFSCRAFRCSSTRERACECSSQRCQRRNQEKRRMNEMCTLKCQRKVFDCFSSVVASA